MMNTSPRTLLPFSHLFPKSHQFINPLASMPFHLRPRLCNPDCDRLHAHLDVIKNPEKRLPNFPEVLNEVISLPTTDQVIEGKAAGEETSNPSQLVSPPNS